MGSAYKAFEILIIDDDDLDRMEIRRILSNLDNIRISEAETGEEALNLLQFLSPDLLITDIFMPQLDGLELITRLAATDRQYPIIAISGHKQQDHISFLRAAKSFGADETFEKSELGEKLLDIVRHMIDEKKHSAPSPNAPFTLKAETAVTISPSEPQDTK